MPKIKAISFIKPQKLQLTYDDHITGIIDCSPKNKESVFHRLSDRDFFQKWKIDTVHNTIVRDSDLDIDGLWCYCEITGKDFYSLLDK